MSEIRSPYDDEIDLFELFAVLWDGKWFIGVFVAVALSIGGGVLLVKDAVYESKLTYEVANLPPFVDQAAALSDFRTMFYAKDTFDSWKSVNETSRILFKDLSNTTFIDGILVSKDEGDRLANLSSKKNGGNFVLVRSNDLVLLNEFFLYAAHINHMLKSNYILRAKDELEMIEARFNDASTMSDNVIQNLLATDRFIVTAEKGADVLSIQRPTFPIKISPKSSLILALSILLGGMAGVVSLLLRNAIRKRKGQAAA